MNVGAPDHRPARRELVRVADHGAEQSGQLPPVGANRDGRWRFDFEADLRLPAVGRVHDVAQQRNRVEFLHDQFRCATLQDRQFEQIVDQLQQSLARALHLGEVAALRGRERS